MQVRSLAKFKRRSQPNTMIPVLVMLFVIFIGMACFAFLSDNDDFTGDYLSPVANQNISTGVIFLACTVLFASYKLIAIFALFVGYKGGRSGQKFFNDRTIDPVGIMRVDFFQAALDF